MWSIVRIVNTRVCVLNMSDLDNSDTESVVLGSSTQKQPLHTDDITVDDLNKYDIYIRTLESDTHVLYTGAKVLYMGKIYNDRDQIAGVDGITLNDTTIIQTKDIKPKIIRTIATIQSKSVNLNDILYKEITTREEDKLIKQQFQSLDKRTTSVKKLMLAHSNHDLLTSTEQHIFGVQGCVWSTRLYETKLKILNNMKVSNTKLVQEVVAPDVNNDTDGDMQRKGKLVRPTLDKRSLSMIPTHPSAKHNKRVKRRFVVGDDDSIIYDENQSDDGNNNNDDNNDDSYVDDFTSSSEYDPDEMIVNNKRNFIDDVHDYGSPGNTKMPGRVARDAAVKRKRVNKHERLVEVKRGPRSNTTGVHSGRVDITNAARRNLLVGNNVSVDIRDTRASCGTGDNRINSRCVKYIVNSEPIVCIMFI